MPQLKDIAPDLKPVDNEVTRVEINDKVSLDVINYLPISRKTDFIIDIINQTLDTTTSTFSPIRKKVFFELNLCKYYAGLDWDDMTAEEAYDIITCNNIFNMVESNISVTEYDAMYHLVFDTMDDIARYNSSFLGILRTASESTKEMDGEIGELIKKIQEMGGVEKLAPIKDMVGSEPEE